MALTLAQAQLIEFAVTQIAEYVALLQKVKTMTDEECKTQLAAQRVLKKAQREELDSH
ncbi:MAG: hypothetical protein JRI72_00635 [Deltaproteobacteria bacterium]|nr:hypothetical protein [Deltaproteobacteria bacterium]